MDTIKAKIIFCTKCWKVKKDNQWNFILLEDAQELLRQIRGWETVMCLCPEHMDNSTGFSIPKTGDCIRPS